jgi:hypothetical protein
MSRREHKHEERTTDGPYDYKGCLNPLDCEPRAHGDVRYVERCDCGATRSVNVADGYAEEGPWIWRDE